ncbi:MAG TPA: CHRD domain-containing protein [Candidatus Limnocylindrales bacterium]|nr:CHRD domain-containing protein [Candidatus Limnocylindrales bacterium]
MASRLVRRVGSSLMVALVVATAAGMAAPRVARADQPPPPSWSSDLSANNVVPGPGDPSLEDSQGFLDASDTPGELCPGIDLPFDATSIGIYLGAAGETGPLVVDLSAYLPDFQCTEDVPQAVIDDLVANPGNYYVQVDSESFPDGATRGQLAIVPPTIFMDVLAFLCPTGTSFPVSDKTLAAKCGALSVPGQDFPPTPGFTSVEYAGMFPWDVHVQGPAGFDQHLADASLNAGGFCDPARLTCFYGALPFSFFNLEPGPTSVDVSAVPTGMKLASTSVEIDGESGIPVTTGPGGHVAMDLTGAYNATPIVRYYFTGSAKLGSVSEAPPTVDLAPQAVSSNGAIALALQYGATEMGSGAVSYAIQLATDGGAYKAAATSSKPLTTIRELPGHSYQFRVQATNSVGVKSAWATGDLLRLDAIQDTDPSIVYGVNVDGWHVAATKGALGGTTSWASDGSSVELTTDATEIGVVMPREPSGGHASIQFGCCDGSTVDLSGGSWQPRQVVAVHNFFGLGSQTVDVTSWGDGRIDLDEFIVLH